MNNSSEFSDEIVREFVLAAHANLDEVMQMLSQSRGLVNVAYEWSANDRETAIQAAAHIGNVEIAEYLLKHGAPMHICTAAMLGRQKVVKRMVMEDSGNIFKIGAHGITVLAHAALSGDVQMVEWLLEQGGLTGMSYALHNAVRKGHLDVAELLLKTGAVDLKWKDFEGKTVLDLALQQGNKGAVELLRSFEERA